VYQLGVLLYFLFAHRLPFKAKTWEALATKIKYEAAKPVFKGKETTIKKMIAELIAECLEKDPQKRPSSAVEVWQQWEKIKYALN
jgi:serine/threonine protein kinase